MRFLSTERDVTRKPCLTFFLLSFFFSYFSFSEVCHRNSKSGAYFCLALVCPSYTALMLFLFRHLQDRAVKFGSDVWAFRNTGAPVSCLPLAGSRLLCIFLVRTRQRCSVRSSPSGKKPSLLSVTACLQTLLAVRTSLPRVCVC